MAKNPLIVYANVSLMVGKETGFVMLVIFQLVSVYFTKLRRNYRMGLQSACNIPVLHLYQTVASVPIIGTFPDSNSLINRLFNN